MNTVLISMLFAMLPTPDCYGGGYGYQSCNTQRAGMQLTVGIKRYRQRCYSHRCYRPCYGHGHYNNCCHGHHGHYGNCCHGHHGHHGHYHNCYRRCGCMHLYHHYPYHATPAAAPATQ